MEYTSNYHLSKPDSDDIINPNSRAGYNGNFDTIDTNLKSVSNVANTNASDITELKSRPIARAENFLDIDRYTMRTINGTASTVSNGILNLNGTSTAGHDMCNVTNSPSTSKGFKVGDVVTFSFRVVGGTATVDSTTNVGLRTYTKDGSTIIKNGVCIIAPEVTGTSWNTSTKGYATTIVTSDMCDIDGLAYFKCYLYCRNNDVYNNCQMTFMLERGTVAHDYEPYKLGYEVKDLLWTNASPSSAFASQTISLDLSNYNEVEIEYKIYSQKGFEKCSVGSKGLFSKTNDASAATNIGGFRTFDVFNNNISFSGAYWNNGAHNEYYVPLKIYGVKKVVA